MTSWKPLKVLYVVRALSVGGAERQAIVQARGLAARGHEVTVATFYAGGALEASARAAGVRVVEIGKSSRWNVLSFLWRLVRLTRALDPDVVHGMLVVPNIVLSALKPVLGRTRVVWGVRASNMNLAEYHWLESVTFQLSRMLSRAADCIIVNSNAGASYHAESGYPSDRMRIIHNGIDTALFTPDRAQGRRVREEFGLGPDHVVMGVAARIDRMKGFEVLLRALPHLRTRHPRLRVVCVGEGNGAYCETLAGMGKALGVDDIVTWVSRRNDMPAVFNAFDIVCSPSVFGEGFSNTIGEAMACAVPCVVTDVGDSRHVVGDTGVVVPAGDDDALARGIHALLRSDLGALGRAARTRIVEIASIERLIDRTERALLEVTT